MVGNGFTLVIVFCSIIVLFAFFQRMKIKRKISGIEKDLDSGIKALSTDINHREYFAENFEDINKVFIKNHSLSHSWHEFKEHLVMPGIKDTDLSIRNSIRPSQFFSEDIITSQRIDLRWVYSIPGKITALGILGTFIGLSIGVYSAASGIKTGNLNTAISQLLDGAALAFISSAVAVIISLAFSYFEKSKINQIELKINQICLLLDKSLLFKTSVQLGQEQLLVQKEQLKVLDSFSNDIAIALGNILEEKFSSSINKGFGDVVSILGSLKETQERLGEGISNEIAKQVTGGVGDQVQNQMNDVVSSLQGMQQLMSEQMNQMISSQSSLQLETKRMVDEISSKIKESQSSINNEVLSTINNFKESFGVFSENMTNNMSKSIEELTSKVVDMNEKVGQDQARITESLQEATEKSKNLMVDGINSSIGKITDTVNNLNLNIKESNNQIITSVENVFKHLEKTLSQFDSNIISFNSSINTQKEVSEVSRQSISMFKDVMNQNRNVGDKFEAAALSVNSFSNNIASFNASIGQYTHNLNEAVTGLKSTVDINANQWGEYAKRFVGIDESLIKMFEQLDQGTRAYGKQVHEHMSDLTIKSEKVVSLFGSAVEGLSEAIEDLADANHKKAS